MREVSGGGRAGAGAPARILALAGKELKMFLVDAQMLFFSLALPLVLVVLMVATFGGQTRFNAKAYVVNLDEGAAGAEFVRRLQAVPELTVEVLDQATADRRLGDSDILNVIVIGPDFSARVAAGQEPRVTVRRRGTGGTEGQIATSYAAAMARQLAGESLVVNRVAGVLAAMGRAVPRATIEAKVASLFEETWANPPVAVVEETVGARPEPVAIFLPGLITMFTVFAISLTSVGIVNERKKGTLERLMTTRLTRGEFLAGNWLGSLGRGLVQIVFLFSLAWAVFRIFTPASFVAVLAFGALAVGSVAGLGLVIAAISRTPDQANWIAVSFTMVMTTLGGSFFDLSGARGAVAVLSRLTYNFWANDGLRRLIVRGESLTSPAIAKDMAVLAGIAVLSWALALTFFRLRGDGK